jgi:hypothetical protein
MVAQDRVPLDGLRWCHPVGGTRCVLHRGAPWCPCGGHVFHAEPLHAEPLQPLVISGWYGSCCLLMQPGITDTLHCRVCCEARGGGGLRGCVGAIALHAGFATMGKVVNYGGCCHGLSSMLGAPLGDLLCRTQSEFCVQAVAPSHGGGVKVCWRAWSVDCGPTR